MSEICIKLCSNLVEESYGPVTQQVADYLMLRGALPLNRIIREVTGIPRNAVQDALKTMIQHGLVTFGPTKTGSGFTYGFHCNMAIELLRIPKYYAHAEKETGAVSREILEEVVRAGWIPISKLIYVCGFRVKTNNPDIEERALLEQLTLFYSTVLNLALRKFIIILPPTPVTIDEESSQASDTNYSGRGSFIVPEVDLLAICSKLLGQKELELEKLPDSNITWKINIKQFHAELRNKMVFEAMQRKNQDNYDTRIIKIIIDAGFEKNPWEKEGSCVTSAEIKDKLEKLEGGDLSSKFLDDQMEIIEEDPKRLISKLNNAHGGQFSFNMKFALAECVWSTIDRIITERHGFLALRIFRLVKEKGFLEQDSIHEIGMISSKDAKNLTYKLMDDHFLYLKDVRRTYTANIQPGKYLFCVNINKIVRNLRESCYKAMFNLKVRAHIEKEKNKHLLSKEEKINRILINMTNKNCSQDQINEIRDLLTPPERALLIRYQLNVRKLLSGTMHVDDTLFLLELYMFYHHFENRVAKRPTKASIKLELDKNNY